MPTDYKAAQDEVDKRISDLNAKYADKSEGFSFQLKGIDPFEGSYPYPKRVKSYGISGRTMSGVPLSGQLNVDFDNPETLGLELLFPKSNPDQPVSGVGVDLKKQSEEMSNKVLKRGDLRQAARELLTVFPQAEAVEGFRATGAHAREPEIGTSGKSVGEASLQRLNLKQLAGIKEPPSRMQLLLKAFKKMKEFRP